MTRRAQALVRACHYDDLASQSPERYPHGCTGEDCQWCDDFPGAAWEAETEMLSARRDKALDRVGEVADVIAAIRHDPAVAAILRALSKLLGRAYRRPKPNPRFHRCPDLARQLVRE